MGTKLLAEPDRLCDNLLQSFKASLDSFFIEKGIAFNILGVGTLIAQQIAATMYLQVGQLFHLTTSKNIKAKRKNCNFKLLYVM